ncbi:MAG: type II-A CRISPR-associated protein Csn2 [Selenomonas ruminantium]|nr:type II-A CRISPR-associated protein Csn2 [Selenomonas ruminantium]
MKLCYPDIYTPITISDEYVASLVIENQYLLYRFLMDICSQLKGETGNVVLSINERLVSIDKGVDLLTDFVTFDGNKKNLLTKIQHAMEKIANDEVYFMRTQRLMAELECYLSDLALEEEVDVAYEKLSLGNLLKSVGMRVIIDYNKLVEKLFAYMDLVKKFEGDKLFILVNLRSFVNDEDMEMFLRTSLEHGMKMLLVEGHACPLLSLEKRRVIDVDLCEI